MEDGECKYSYYLERQARLLPVTLVRRMSV